MHNGRFHKMHGLGNDFVIVDAREEDFAPSPAMAAAIADRHQGIGCDQLIVLEQSEQADLRMRIYNADGSEAEACGNATRCVVALIGRDIEIETSAGTLQGITGDLPDVAMGVPRFGWEDIPLAYAVETAAMPVGYGPLEPLLRLPDVTDVLVNGADGVFVGSGIFKSGDPAIRAKAIVEATTHYEDPEVLIRVSENLGEAMVGINIDTLDEKDKLQTRGW